MKYIQLFLFLLINYYSSALPVKITRVVDGDTADTETGERIRLIGINAPELSDIFGNEAKQCLKKLIEGKQVELLSDTRSKDRDVYNRLLRYITLDGVDINKKMIADGFAFAYLKYQFDKANEYKNAQISAMKNQLGLWSKGENNLTSQKQNLSKDLWVQNSFSIIVISVLIFLLIAIGAFYYFKR